MRDISKTIQFRFDQFSLHRNVKLKTKISLQNQISVFENQLTTKNRQTCVKPWRILG